MKPDQSDLRQGDFVFKCVIDGKEVSPSTDTNAVLTTQKGKSFQVKAFYRGEEHEPIPTEAHWQSSREDIASIERSGRGVQIKVHGPGVSNITVTLGHGRDKRVAAFTLVEASELLLFGPDGRYYLVEAEKWKAAPVDEHRVGDVTKALLHGGSPYFTNGPLKEPYLKITCTVVNLASMCNENFPGPVNNKG